MPLYQFLGGAALEDPSPMPARHCCIPTRAISTTSRERIEEGYRAIKFHCWCNPALDLPMCEAVRAHFGDGLSLMLDVEQRYDLRSALRVGRRIAELGFEWFEAPLPDTNIEGYRQLKRETGVPIIAAGNTWLDLQQLAQADPYGLLELRCASTPRSAVASRRSARSWASPKLSEWMSRSSAGAIR